MNEAGVGFSHIFKAKASIHIVLKVPSHTFWEPSCYSGELPLPCFALSHWTKGLFCPFIPAPSSLCHYFCRVVFVLASYHTIKNKIEKRKKYPHTSSASPTHHMATLFLSLDQLLTLVSLTLHLRLPSFVPGFFFFFLVLISFHFPQTFAYSVSFDKHTLQDLP